MKKVLGLVLAAGFFFLTATGFSQVRIAPKVGLNIANYSMSEGDPKSIVSFHAGVVGDYSFGNLYLQSGLLFSQKGYKVSESILVGNVDVKTTVNTLELPVNLGYAYDLGGAKLFGYAGPYFGYAINGKSKGTVSGLGDSNSESEDLVFGSGDGEMRRFELGWNLGVGVEFNKFQVSAQFGRSFTNLVNSYDVKNQVFGISVAYFFDLK